MGLRPSAPTNTDLELQKLERCATHQLIALSKRYHQALLSQSLTSSAVSTYQGIHRQLQLTEQILAQRAINPRQPEPQIVAHWSPRETWEFQHATLQWTSSLAETPAVYIDTTPEDTLHAHCYAKLTVNAHPADLCTSSCKAEHFASIHTAADWAAFVATQLLTPAGKPTPKAISHYQASATLAADVRKHITHYWLLLSYHPATRIVVVKLCQRSQIVTAEQERKLLADMQTILSK